jgi:3-hydroxyisobutyrate dehydrogenase-like beta-hydroxyacid dehydrogenase
MRIGFIGLGRMGSAMAARLVGTYDLTVMDTDRVRTDEMARLGARAAPDLAGLVAERELSSACFPPTRSCWR